MDKKLKKLVMKIKLHDGSEEILELKKFGMPEIDPDIDHKFDDLKKRITDIGNTLIQNATDLPITPDPDHDINALFEHLGHVPQDVVVDLVNRYGYEFVWQMVGICNFYGGSDE